MESSKEARTHVKRSGMKGYYTTSGYMGYTDGEYMLFASEEDYREYIED